jgi:NADPH:quinone reductase-like Zn-dependent oxidoreductase
MRAAVLWDFGGPEGLVLEDWPDPEPAPGEALVRVHAVCVNRTDLHVMHGTNIGRGIQLPHIGGVDPAGQVVSLGDGVTGLRTGQRVVARPMIPCLECRFCRAGWESGCERPQYVGVHRPGGFAELVALPARALYPIPDGVSYEAASAVAHSVPMALHLLRSIGEVGPADRVLVVGASGGLGLAAVQIARWLGAAVIAAAGSDEKVAVACRLGADAGVVYAPIDGFAVRVRAVTGGLGVTVAVDNVGDPPLWAEVVDSLDKGGRILSCGAHAGGQVGLDLALFYRRQLRLISTSGTTHQEFLDALRLTAEGVVRPLVHRVFEIEEIHAAVGELIARRNAGKIVVRVA